MKVIRQLNSPTPGLAEYLSQEPAQPTFPRFLSHDGGTAYRELRDALVEAQHGLCGYCEVNLLENDRQIEHFVPQSAGDEGQKKAVDHSNMIACCWGGDQVNLFGPDTINPDPERYIRPTGDSRSCGAAKGNTTDPWLIDPRTLPPSPSPFKVQIDGSMVSDSSACADLGIPVPQVERTIQILGLNVRRLKANRAIKWENLAQVWGEDLIDPARANLAARVELLPTTESQLPKYFITSTVSRKSYNHKGDQAGLSKIL